MAWTIEVGGVAKEFQGARITWVLGGPGSIEVDLKEPHIDAAWIPGLSEIVAKEDGTPRWGGYLERVSRSGPAGDPTFTASGYGYQKRLDFRGVRHAYTIEGTHAQIVNSLLDEVQVLQLNGDMGFLFGPAVGTFDTDEEAYCFGVVIGDAIHDLGNSFDWEVGADKRLRMWAPQRGVDSGAAIALADCIDFDVDTDTGDMLTTVSAIGSPDDPFGPIHDMVRSMEAVTYGRREAFIDVDSTRRPKLLRRARKVLKANGGARLDIHTRWLDPHSSLTALRPDLSTGSWPFGAVWLDDKVSVPLDVWLGGNSNVRCTQIDVTLEATGGELRWIEHRFTGIVDTFIESEEAGG